MSDWLARRVCPDLDEQVEACLEALSKPPMVTAPEGFYILGDDGHYTRHDYDPEIDAALARGK